MRRRFSVIISSVFMCLSRFTLVPDNIQGACQTGSRVRVGLSRGITRFRASENRPESRARSRRVWRMRNTLRRVLATLASAAIIAPVAAGQDDPPGPDKAMEAFESVQSWILDWAVPDEAPYLGVECAGAHVILRYQGAVVGRAADMRGNDESIWRATRAAWIDAAGRLPIERDALAARNIREIAPDIQISLELAGPTTPLLADTFGQLVAEYNPGLHGMVVHATGRSKAIFPAAMLIANDSPGDSVRKALIELFDNDLERLYGPALDFRSPVELRQREGAAFHRFRVTHVAQLEPRSSPVFLHRGGRYVELTHLRVDSLREWADGLAAHLRLRAWPGAEPFGMVGTYNPITGESRPHVATPAEQALVAIAMRRYASSRRAAAEQADAAEAFAVELLQDLARIEPHEADPAADHTPAALFIAAWFESGPPPQALTLTAGELFAACLRTVTSAIDDEGRYAADVSRSAHGPLALALVRHAKHGGDPQLARRAIALAFDQTPTEQLVSHMPWLGWAMLEGPQYVAAEQRQALMNMRALILAHRLTADDLHWQDRDFAGGIVFTIGQTPLPTWHTARPASILAAMAADEALTPASVRPAELVNVLTILRFLRQLTADESSLSLARAPARARWGVRSALWDQRMPSDASALTLTTLLDTLTLIELMTPTK